MPIHALRNKASAVVLTFRPGFQGAAQVHQLAEVIGIMICENQRLAKKCLSATPRKGSVQVNAGIGDESNHPSQVALKRLYALMPRGIIGRGGSFGPIALRK